VKFLFAEQRFHRCESPFGVQKSNRGSRGFHELMKLENAFDQLRCQFADKAKPKSVEFSRSA
jgi:hypothetical protein